MRAMFLPHNHGVQRMGFYKTTILIAVFYENQSFSTPRVSLLRDPIQRIVYV